MQYGKKLALIDPKILEQLQVDREYKMIQRPAPTVAKSSLSLDIGHILDDQTIPDDEKVKLYQNALRRYTNIRNVIQVTDVPPPPPLSPPPPPAAMPAPAAIPTPLPPVILPLPRVASPLTPKSPQLFTSTDLKSTLKERSQLLKRRILPRRAHKQPIRWEPYWTTLQ